MTVKKFNYVRFIGFIVIIIGLVVGITLLVKHINYTKTNEYKLLQIGYSLDETEIIEKKLNSAQIDKLLNSEYDENLINYLKEKRDCFTLFYCNDSSIRKGAFFIYKTATRCR